MKYSKAVAFAVAALSVVSLASAATGGNPAPATGGNPAPANPTTAVTYCTGDNDYLLDGTCHTVNPLPAHTLVVKVAAASDEVAQNPKAHRNTLKCFDNSKVESGKAIQIDGCKCDFGDKADGTCSAPPPPPKHVECSGRYTATAPDDATKCVCRVGTIEKEGKCGIVETSLEGCAILNRQFVNGTCGQCIDNDHVFINNPKNASEVLGNACYKKNGISEADCNAKANETHREPKDGFCLCKEGYTFQSPEDVSSQEQPCKSSAAALIMSSTAVLAFIGSLAYLI